ncbi:MAG: hypothetical protein K2X11_11365 [Acetobacteraceae bacterium]|nr:hypothetical protein [Acetobacteraceae bacterium]
MSSAILGYAYLRAFFGEGAQSPLDAMAPLVKRALLRQKGKPLQPSAVQAEITSHVGIEIPINVIRYLFGKLTKEGVLVLNKDYHHLVNPSYKFDSQIEILERAARERYNRIVRFISPIMVREKITKFRAADLIEFWLDHSAVAFLGDTNPAYEAGSDDFEVNRVIALACFSEDGGDQFLEDLTEIALGDAIFRAVKVLSEFEVDKQDEPMPEGRSTEFHRRMSGVSVFFDTRIVIRILAFSDRDYHKAAAELLSICQATGCKVCVFRHNVDEVQRIIEAVAARLASSQPIEGELGIFAIENGYDAGDLLQLSLDVDAKLEKLGVAVIEKPPIANELSIDERALDERLRIDLDQDYEIARITDIASLSAIYRLRGGEEKNHLEDCNAIFITNNKGLADSSVRFFRSHFTRNGKSNRVQICMTDVVFSTRLWTKLPTSLKTLPRQQVISHILGNLRPSLKVKESFLRNIKSLVADGRMSQEGYVRLELGRYTNRMLALEFGNRQNDLDRKEAADIANKIIVKQREILNVLRSDSEKDLNAARKELNSLNRELQQIQEAIPQKDNEISDLVQRTIEQQKKIDFFEAERSRIQTLAAKISSWIAYGGCFTILGLTISQSFSFFGDGSLLANLLAIAIAVIGAFGFSFTSLHQKISRHIYRVIARILLGNS